MDSLGPCHVEVSPGNPCTWAPQETFATLHSVLDRRSQSLRRKVVERMTSSSEFSFACRLFWLSGLVTYIKSR